MSVSFMMERRVSGDAWKLRDLRVKVCVSLEGRTDGEEKGVCQLLDVRESLYPELISFLHRRSDSRTQGVMS